VFYPYREKGLMRHARLIVLLIVLAGASCQRDQTRQSSSTTPNPQPPVPGSVPSSASQVTSPKSASSTNPYALRITRFESPRGFGSIPLTDALELLDVNDGPAANGDGDVSCNVPLSRNGPVSPTSVPFNGRINNENDFNTLCGQGGYVHVVNQINWCGASADNIIGCATIGSGCMVVVRYAPDEVLWAHEYGHTRRLEHSCGDPGMKPCGPKEDDRVMHPYIERNHRKIGSLECGHYK
jgi:hypothetical protein